jgi:hypothetical protein
VENFSHTKMVEGYEAVYYQLLEKRLAGNGRFQSSQILQSL